MQEVTTEYCGEQGAMPSVTVTVAVQVLLLPQGSVTVSVTVLSPTFVQLNVDGETLSVRY
jgi:hypothetical protein